MLKWYIVVFESSIFFSSLDINLIKEFVNLFIKEHSPDGLALYIPKIYLNEGMAYYLSTPEECLDRVKNFLEAFSSMEVSTPDYKSIELVAGINTECLNITYL